MIVITLTDCPISLRGDLTKWLLEINTGVFVGRVSARIRDNLWKRIIDNVKNGRATLVYNTNNEQHMDFRIHNSTNDIIDFDGLKLVMQPTFARTEKLTQKRMGFSKAAKMRMAKRMCNKTSSKSRESTVIYPSDYVIIDLETSGLNNKNDEIIEIGMLKVNTDKIVDKFNFLVKPKQEISQKIEQLTGISNALLNNDGEKIETLLPDINKFIGSSILIGHNILFDIGFLNQILERNDSKLFDNKYYDTMAMYAESFKIKGKRKKLIDIAKEFNIKVVNCHRALADCYTVKAIYDILKQESKRDKK